MSHHLEGQFALQRAGWTVKSTFLCFIMVPEVLQDNAAAAFLDCAANCYSASVTRNTSLTLISTDAAPL